MKKVIEKIKVQLFALVILSTILCSCSKNNEGYIEVRNKTQYEIENVNWGGLIDFGTILPDGKNGTETKLTGDEYINLEIDNEKYRSKDKITVDARTSATFIIKDTINLIKQ